MQDHLNTILINAKIIFIVVYWSSSSYKCVMQFLWHV